MYNLLRKFYFWETIFAFSGILLTPSRVTLSVSPPEAAPMNAVPNGQRGIVPGAELSA